MASKKSLANQRKEAVGKVINNFTKSQKFHDEWVTRIDRYYDAYRGLLSITSEASDWTSKLHPRYIHQVVETITSSLVDPTFRFEVSPRAKAVNSDEWQSMIAGAQTLERLLAFELDTDNFNDKQRPFVLQGNICGLSVLKTRWETKEGWDKRLELRTEALVDDNGIYLGSYPRMTEVSTETMLRDGPTVDVVDVRDFMWQEGATDIAHSEWLIHRLWKTYEEIEFLEAKGIYGVEAGGEACSALSESMDQSATLSNREQKYSRELRTKDRIEVLEYWTDREVITIGNRTVLMSRKPNVFWHGQKPFVVASPMPDLFRIPGMSIVELIADLQEMLWTLGNQRLDATRLLASPAYAVRSDLDDFGQLEEIAPGSLIVVEDPNQIKPFEINPQLPRLTLEAEGMIKQDLQSITNGAPLMPGVDTTDQKTATGASIVASVTQRAMATRKSQYVQAYEKMAWQWVSMLQQFLRDDSKVIPIVGENAEMRLLKVNPADIQLGPHFDVEIDGSNDSMIRQERRAEAQSLLQVAVQAAPVFAAMQTPLNIKAFMDDYLRSFDVDDTARYYMPQAPPQGAPPGQQPPGQPGQPQPGQPPAGAPAGPMTGVTNPTAAAGPNAPSNPASMSPVAAMQRMGAMSGGVRNA